jgi:hypothetical protein
MEGAVVGLCTRCVHGRAVVSGRGSSFWLCQLSASDPRFAKYPRLPVLRCAGFEPRGDQGNEPPPGRQPTKA